MGSGKDYGFSVIFISKDFKENYLRKEFAPNVFETKKGKYTEEENELIIKTMNKGLKEGKKNGKF